MSEIILEFYAVRNYEGKWFRAKGFGGYGPSWVDDIKKARIYNRIGPARSQVTYFANRFPLIKNAEVVKLNVTSMEVLDEDLRVAKAKEKKLQEKAALEARVAKRKLEAAEREFNAAKANLDKLKGR